MHEDGDSYHPVRQCRGSGTQLSACPETDRDPLPEIVVDVATVSLRVLQVCTASFIPPLLHTHEFTHH
jgi:hypothetical protein